MPLSASRVMQGIEAAALPGSMQHQGFRAPTKGKSRRGRVATGSGVGHLGHAGSVWQGFVRRYRIRHSTGYAETMRNPCVSMNTHGDVCGGRPRRATTGTYQDVGATPLHIRRKGPR